MAIRARQGNNLLFDKNKLLPGEHALVLDKGELYFCYGAGTTKKLQTAEDLQALLNASPTAYTALQHLITDLNSNPSELTNILNNITALQTNKLDKTGDGKDNVETFVIATTEADIASGEKHSVLFGKILKSINTFRTAITGKAPTSHASTATTYGIGTPANYGHAKTINALTQSTHADGTALSAYQGYLLNTNKFDKANIGQTDIINDATKVPSTVVTHALGAEIDALNNNLVVNAITIAPSANVTIDTTFASAKVIGKVVYVNIKISVTAEIGTYASVVLLNLPSVFSGHLIFDNGLFYCQNDTKSIGAAATLAVGTYNISGTGIMS